MDVGQVIDGKYELVRLLGAGGMGAVYEARHVRIGRRLALKVLHAKLAENAEMVARFVREAQAAAAIGSEHIVEVTDAGEAADGTPFLVMEYLEGRTLAQVLIGEGPLEPSRAVRLVSQAAAGLEAAHRAGIIHRDVKPGNLVVTRKADGAERVKVLDFGVAKIREALPTMAGQSPELTGTAATLGTPYYMAPEQAWGSKKATAQTDIYALGVVLYEILTGNRPYQANTYNELIVRIATEEPPPPRRARPELSEALEAVILKAMAREPEARYASMAELARALEPFTAGGAGLNATGSTSPERPSGRAAKRREAPPASLELAPTLDASVPTAPGSTSGPGRRRLVAWLAVAGVAAVAAALGLAVHLGAVSGPGPAAGPVRGRVEGSGERRGHGPSAVTVAGRDAGAAASDSGPAPADAGAVDADAADADGDAGADADVACPPAMVATAGRCCWPGQTWSAGAGQCVGRAACTGGMAWRGGTCACPEGQELLGEHCCWPGQSWSEEAARCAGPARCDHGFRPSGEEACEPDVGTALGRLIQGCQRGSMAACVGLGESLQDGRAADRARSVVLFRQGCDGGEARGCHLLGRAYQRGGVVPADPAGAAELFLEACVRGEAAACADRAEIALEARETSRAAGLFERACTARHVPGCVRLGELYSRGAGVSRDEARAVELFERACTEGDAGGCAWLAWALDGGHGVAPDPAHAFALAQRACDAGEARACRLLGQLYLHGRGVIADATQAERYTRRACEGGETDACRDLDD